MMLSRSQTYAITAAMAVNAVWMSYLTEGWPVWFCWFAFGMWFGRVMQQRAERIRLKRYIAGDW
jgi:hypothetical protein